MRYLRDEDLSTSMALIARGLGLDVVSVQDMGRRGWTDEEQLEMAAEGGRCIVTANRNDFQRLTERFAVEARPHGGVLIVPYTLRAQTPTALAHALAAFDQARGGFPFEYLCDFLLPADQYGT